MTVKVHVQQFLSLQLGNDEIRMGGLTKPTTLDVDGLKFDRTVLCLINTTELLFSVVTDLDDFDVLALETDLDVMIELVTDDDASIGERSYTFELKGSGAAGVMGPKVFLFSDTSYANHTVNFAAGTLDVIQTVRCRRLAAGTATVRCLAIT